jgi:hypothetical protein
MTGREQEDDESWLDREIAGSEFKDTRLRKRFGTLLEQLWRGMGQTIPLACQDWANTKAAYRFMDNDRVSEQDILSGHFQATAQRFSTTDGPILVLQDTTTFSYEREHPELIGYAGSAITSAQRRGRAKPSPQCGILMHSSLAVTAQGLPLGLAAIKFWSRKEFKDTATRRSKVNFTRIPIEKKESFRWIENLRQSTTRLGDADRCVHTKPIASKASFSSACIAARGSMKEAGDQGWRFLQSAQRSMNDGFELVLGLDGHLGDSGFHVAPDQFVRVEFR